MIAAHLGYLEMAKLLIEKGADVNAECKDGATALKIASLEGHPEVVELLKAHGARETGVPTLFSDSNIWNIAALLLIAFASIVYCRIAKNRRMGWISLLLGLAVWSVVFSRFVTPGNDEAFSALIGFIPLSGAIADLIATPVLRRRVIPPSVRVRRTPIYRTVHSFFYIALGILFVSNSFRSPTMMFSWELLTVSMIIYLYNVLTERVEVCANGVSQYQGLRPWEEYESFSWKRETKYGVELWIVPRSWRSWVCPSLRLLVAPEDREAVQQILATHLQDQSSGAEVRNT
jgi:hypothetical protein